MKKFKNGLMYVFAVSAMMFISACGGGGGGGSSEGGPVLEEAVYDATGIWVIFAETPSITGNCSNVPEMGSSGQWIEQEGNTFYFGDNAGTVNGAQYTLINEGDKDGVHYSITYDFSLDSSDTGTGSITFKFSKSGCSSCNCKVVYEFNLVKQNTPSTLKLSSSAFADRGTIPSKYACTALGGVNISPSFSWTNVPAGTKSFALILNDPDNGDLTHWVLYGISPAVRSIPENIPDGMYITDSLISGGAIQLMNGYGNYGYDGPCTAENRPHYYEFILIALDTMLTAVSSENDLENAISGHVLGISQLYGKF